MQKKIEQLEFARELIADSIAPARGRIGPICTRITVLFVAFVACFTPEMVLGFWTVKFDAAFLWVSGSKTQKFKEVHNC